MKKIYVIAHTWRDTEMTIEHFYTPHKAIKRIAEITDWKKPCADGCPEEYLQQYYESTDGYNDCYKDITIILEVIPLPADKVFVRIGFEDTVITAEEWRSTNATNYSSMPYFVGFEDQQGISCNEEGEYLDVTSTPAIVTSKK
jgi:hypothetical protein